MPEINNQDKKECPVCGDEFRGRSDKKFCSDQCRNLFNNSQNRTANNYVRNINNILRKNRKVLMELNPEGKTSVKSDELVRKGMDFEHVTSIMHTKTGNTYYFCYEYGYRKLENNYFMLVKKKIPKEKGA